MGIKADKMPKRNNEFKNVSPNMILLISLMVPFANPMHTWFYYNKAFPKLEFSRFYHIYRVLYASFDVFNGDVRVILGYDFIE